MKSGHDVMVIDPATTHYYQPGFCVFFGQYRVRHLCKHLAGLLRRGVKHLRAVVVSVRSHEKTLQLDSGESVSYNVLVIAMSGNPDMYMPEIAGVVPGMETFATYMMQKRMTELDIPGVSEFLDIIKAAGG